MQVHEFVGLLSFSALHNPNLQMVKVQLDYLHIFLEASLKVTSLSSFLRLVAFTSKLQKKMWYS